MSFKPEKSLKPKRIGRVVLRDFDLSILFNNLNRDMLFLRFFGLKKSDRQKLEEFNREFEVLKDEIIRDEYIKPKGIYGIYKVHSSKEMIKIYADEEIFEIPLQINRDGISLADFLFEDDYVAFTSASCFLNDEVVYTHIEHNDFKKLYIINSINTMLAEAFTEVLHYLAAKDMGLEVAAEMKELYLHKNPGRRYSPGYVGIDILANMTIHKLLKAVDIGSSITESGMIEPQSSVQSLIIFNDKAFYL